MQNTRAANGRRIKVSDEATLVMELFRDLDRMLSMAYSFLERIERSRRRNAAIIEEHKRLATVSKMMEALVGGAKMFGWLSPERSDLAQWVLVEVKRILSVVEEHLKPPRIHSAGQASKMIIN